MSTTGAQGAPTLLVFAHPAFERARVGRALLAAASALPFVSVRDLYGLYPDTTIDVPDEQRALATHRLIVLQFPLYWYSTPALLKEWLDLVWLHGWAYGQTGDALAGKRLAVAFSAGGPPEAYASEGLNRYTVEEFMRPLERTAALCRMEWSEPFVVHGAALLDEAALTGHAERYAAWLVEQAAAVAAAGASR